MIRTLAEINDRIKQGKVVVATAEELIEIVQEKGVKEAFRTVDVVTTGTFGPMCSSGMYFNTGHSKPRIKLGGGKVLLNDVPCYTGLAAVDLFLGASALPENDPRNANHPGLFRYGGAHVIEELVSGKDIRLTAEAYGTDCYPRKTLATRINIRDLNEAVLFNPRNAYQNYAVAVNFSDRTLYTYMGTLRPHLGNATYSSAGQLSPLLKDPVYRTIGLGSRIFLGGGIGYVVWHGTQHNPDVPRSERGVPLAPSGTLAVMGDLKQMTPEYLKGVSFRGYGVTLGVGIGIPIPILDEDICERAALTDDDLLAPIIDYGNNYPQGIAADLGRVSYAQLKSGVITVQGKEVKTAPLSSYPKAVAIAKTLKRWIEQGDFTLTEPVAPLPGMGSGYKCKPMIERPLTDA